MSLTDDLEKLGESGVRRRLVNGGFGQPGSQNYSSVQEWVRGKEIERTNTRADTNAVDHLEAILQQKAHEADRKLGEAISWINAATLDMNPKADVLIVTTTQVESHAVMDVFRNATGNAPQPARIADRVYHDLGEINSTRVFLALSEMGASGLGASLQTIQKGIDSLKPSAVIMVGIAFGINEQKQGIGDILVSTQLWLYDLQRVGSDMISSRGDKVHASPILVNHFKSADLYPREAKAKFRFGLLLTGEKLIDNLDYREGLKKFEREAIGGEMEGAGLYVACQDRKVEWILVKAICDWADGHKAEDKNQRQELAATNAASFVLHALQMAPIIPDRSPSQRRNSSGAPTSRILYCSRCGVAAAAGSSSVCVGAFTYHDFRGFSNDNVFCSQCGTKAGSRSNCAVGFTAHDFRGFSNDSVFCSRCGAKAGSRSNCAVGFTAHDFRGFSNDSVFCSRCGAKAGSRSNCAVGFTAHDFKGF